MEVPFATSRDLFAGLVLASEKDSVKSCSDHLEEVAEDTMLGDHYIVMVKTEVTILRYFQEGSDEDAVAELSFVRAYLDRSQSLETLATASCQVDRWCSC